MFNQNSIFIAPLDEKRQLVLLCGGKIDGSVSYFPTNPIVDEFVIQGGYKDAEPCSALGATTIELKINTASFNTEEEQRLALAIWVNCGRVPFLNGVALAPNIWIFIEDGKISFIGAQDAVSGDEAFPSSDEPFKIMISSLHKGFLETGRFPKLSLVNKTVPSILDCKLWEGFKIKKGMNSEPYYQYYHKIAGWGRSQFTSISEFMEQFKIMTTIANVSLLKFKTNISTFLNYNIAFPKFYRQVLEQNSTALPSGELDISDILILNTIADKNYNLVGGALKSATDRFKNLYELFKMLCDNFALKMLYHIEHVENFDPKNKDHYESIKIVYDLIPIARKEAFKAKITPSNIVESPKLVRRVGEYEGVLVNNLPVHPNDVESVSETDNAGSNRKTKTDNAGSNRKTKTVSILFNTTPTKVLAHLNDPNTPTRDYVALSNYSAKDGEAMPVMKFFYKYNFGGRDYILKASERVSFEVGDGQEFDNDFTAVDVFSGHNLNDFNKNVESMQTKGLSGVLAKIYYEVITRSPLFLELKINADFISHKDLGKAFEIDPQLLQGANTFWRFTDTSTYAVLTDVKENLTTGVCECKFFLRTDKWKI